LFAIVPEGERTDRRVTIRILPETRAYSVPFEVREGTKYVVTVTAYGRQALANSDTTEAGLQFYGEAGFEVRTLLTTAIEIQLNNAVPNVDFSQACDTDVITWDPIDNARAYEVYDPPNTDTVVTTSAHVTNQTTQTTVRTLFAHAFVGAFGPGGGGCSPSGIVSH
jgi:hypothetical protein